MASRSVPAAKKSINQDVFIYTVPGTSRKISIRSIESMTMREIQGIEKMKFSDLLDLASTDASRENMMDLTKREFTVFAKAWATGGEVDLGKSSAS